MRMDWTTRSSEPTAMEMNDLKSHTHSFMPQIYNKMNAQANARIPTELKFWNPLLPLSQM